MIEKLIDWLVPLLAALLGLGPVFMVLLEERSSAGLISSLLLCNFLGWTLVITVWLWRTAIHRSVRTVAQRLSIDTRFLPFFGITKRLCEEIERKNSAFLVNLIEGRIASKEELGQALQRVVQAAYRLLSAESAELALFDKESGLYHSSFVLGKPFRSDAQAMLSDVREARELTSNPEVIVLPISFGATVLGTLRIAMTKGRLPTPADRENARLLAIQGGVAIINAQFTQEVVRMRAVSEESVKAKTGFLANLSHEIRGPLGIILNAVELVLEGLCGTVSDEQAQTLRMVQTNGAHLLELINDVLDYAKLEAGKVTVQPVDIPVNELLRDLSGVVRAQAEAKSHRLVCRDAEAALAVRCDRRHARQMLINLLTNAIKYTPDGGTLELYSERGTGGKVRICVKDSGIGIEESQRHKVFAAFERVEQAYALHQVGTGLGMPLTRKLAEANGGQVDFQSTPGKGSLFWIQLPAVVCSAETIAQESVQEAHVQGANDLVLLVERDEGELGMHARALTHAGFRVGSACGKIDAVTLAMQNKFALVIIDNAIIDEVGDDFVGQLRATSKDATLPILVLTSRAFVFDVENYLRLGIDRCVAKPVSIRDLLKTARELIDDARMARELKSRRPVVEPRSPRDQGDKFLH